MRELNTSLQKVLNPTRPGQPVCRAVRMAFPDRRQGYPDGERLRQGRVQRRRRDRRADGCVEQQVAIRFDDRVVKYDFGELDEVSLAYAVTIHKSQGSEFPAVVIPLATQHYMLLQRNLIYTGITRGKRLLVLIGQKKALGIAVRNDRPQRRYSGLLASLRGKHPDREVQ